MSVSDVLQNMFYPWARVRTHKRQKMLWQMWQHRDKWKAFFVVVHSHFTVKHLQTVLSGFGPLYDQNSDYTTVRLQGSLVLLDVWLAGCVKEDEVGLSVCWTSLPLLPWSDQSLFCPAHQQLQLFYRFLQRQLRHVVIIHTGPSASMMEVGQMDLLVEGRTNEPRLLWTLTQWRRCCVTEHGKMEHFPYVYWDKCGINPYIVNRL